MPPETEQETDVSLTDAPDVTPESEEAAEDELLSPDAEAALAEQELEPEVEEEEEEAEEPTISDELKERAIEAGYEEEEIDSFAPDALERTLELMDQKTAKIGKEAPAEVEAEPDEPFKLSLKGDDYLEPEKVQTEMERMVAHFEARLNAQAEVQGGLISHNEQQADLATQGRLDNYIEGLGKEWEGTFKKPAAVTKLKEEADALAAGYKATGKKVPSEKVRWDRARMILHSDKIQTRTRQGIAKRLRNREGQFTSPPASRGEETISGEQLAIRHVEAKLREMAPQYTEDEVGLPD